MSSFVRFVLKHKRDDTPYGDVARDVLQDESINRAWGFRTFKKYLENRGACERVLDLVDELHEVYATVQASLYRTKSVKTN